MPLAGALGRLFTGQGVVGLVLALLANGHDRPAAAWTIAFMAGVLLSTGMLLWLVGNDTAEAADAQQAAAKAQARREGLREK